MIEVDKYAARAIESPVAQPPEMATLVAMANRHRRGRRGRRAALVTGFISAAVAVAVIIAFSLRPTDSGNLNVTATSPTATSTTDTGSFVDELTVAGLTARLARDGFHIDTDGTAPGNPFAAVAQLLCVDGTQVRVYEYPDAAARAAFSAGISLDGSQLTLPSTGTTTRTIIVEEWVGPPHFFAGGRVIVLVLRDDDRLLRALSRILGPTISPRALRLPDHRSPCTKKAP
jgi:hypothetical protein